MTRAGTQGASGGRLRRRAQLSDEVADHLRGQIMSGQLRPGEFVRLDETAAHLGVSITPVREALLTLRGEGVVRLEPHRGYLVAPLSRDDVADVFWLQGQIAVELAQRAARGIDEAALAGLAEITERMAGAVARGDADAVAGCEHEFHRAINQHSGGSKLAWFLQNAIRFTPYRLYAENPGWGAETVANHEQLLKALRAKDVERVGELTRAQFTDGARRLIAHLEAVGLWDEH